MKQMWIFLAVAFGLAACGGSATPMVITATPEPATETPEPTRTPIPTVEPVPTETPEASAIWGMTLDGGQAFLNSRGYLFEQSEENIVDPVSAGQDCFLVVGKSADSGIDTVGLVIGDANITDRCLEEFSLFFVRAGMSRQEVSDLLNFVADSAEQINSGERSQVNRDGYRFATQLIEGDLYILAIKQ